MLVVRFKCINVLIVFFVGLIILIKCLWVWILYWLCVFLLMCGEINIVKCFLWVGKGIGLWICVLVCLVVFMIFVVDWLIKWWLNVFKWIWIFWFCIRLEFY